ncbi:hypothetical protein VMCG_01487 [Cytospora schulzeri]|uniref:Uncharacterized protein n=1 Tax=Cytospora schulzeri TaxID=448051 RepID=A0A423X5J4_9PEZI|nr:hypothetical protein VMCG_01487 [Valsa malicola]
MAAPEQPIVAAAPPSGSGDFSSVNVVETPTSPSSAFTLSRFEFETGTKGNEGTKILMVEWDAVAAIDSAAQGTEAAEEEKARNSMDDWDVRWDGKEALTVLPIRDGDGGSSNSNSSGSLMRVYFLVPPGAPIPTLVTIAKSSGLTELRTKPLPAIFPEGLVGGDKGTRGVLHTIWARKRLHELGAEITAEMKSNGESVGLEMALQERQWIVDHFGLEIDTSSAEAIPLAPSSPGGGGGATSPASPRSPIGGRLGEKLRGLKLATSPAELLAAKDAINTKKQAERKITVFTPPESGGAGLGLATSGGLASLGAVMEGGPAAAAAPARGGDTEEDLFALPMSPRSPEEAKSPFSMLKC